MNTGEVNEIKSTIEKAYIQGIHVTQKRDLIDSGFHSDFEMLVMNGKDLDKVTIDKWLVKIDIMKQEDPELWKSDNKAQIEILDLKGNVATARIILHKGKTYFSTDYMLLYKQGTSWKIVSKVFTVL